MAKTKATKAQLDEIKAALIAARHATWSTKPAVVLEIMTEHLGKAYQLGLQSDDSTVIYIAEDFFGMPPESVESARFMVEKGLAGIDVLIEERYG